MNLSEQRSRMVHGGAEGSRTPVRKGNCESRYERSSNYLVHPGLDLERGDPRTIRCLLLCAPPTGKDRTRNRQNDVSTRTYR